MSLPGKLDISLTLLTLGGIVFEGDAHPYRENLIKFDGRIAKREPEVSTELLKQNSL